MHATMNCALENLHNRLSFELGKKTKSFIAVRKSRKSLVAKCCKTRKIYPSKVCKFCICFYYMDKSVL